MQGSHPTATPFVRPMVEADLPAVHSLNAALQEFERQLRPSRVPGAQMTEAYVAKLRAEVADANGEVVVAKVGAEVAGFASWYWEHDPLERDPNGIVIGDLFVVESWRARGVGRAIVAYIRQISIEQGAGWLTVATLSANDQAMSFYRACGFEILMHTLHDPGLP